MSHPDSDTIYALASGSGRSAIAVIRIAGWDSARVVGALCDLPPPRRAALRTLRDSAGAMLDKAVVIWQPGPSTYTGEDGAELQVHGGIAVIRAVSDSLNVAGARPAEPGEFTKRAFLNRKIDLLGAEAVADLVDAETESQRRQALRQLDGELGDVVQVWSARLQRLLAYQEALIDFVEEDLPGETEARVVSELTSLRDEINLHLSDGRAGQRLREGITIAVVGPPNVGKSSLVNALAERDVAIVSPIAGTTRDALETRLDIGGVLVTLIDTAGIRDSDDPIEIEGVRRARRRAASADLLVSVSDPTTSGWTDERPTGPIIEVLNKADLGSEVIEGRLAVSAVTGAGLADLRACLATVARRLAEHASAPPLTRERHRSALIETVRLLGSASSACWPELRSEDIRHALRALGRLHGWIGVDDVLDVVFREFCIGK